MTKKRRSILINKLPNHLREEVKKLEESLERWRGIVRDGTATDDQLDAFWTLISDILIEEEE